MTERTKFQLPANPFARTLLVSGGILALFALNLFVLQPLLTRGIGPGVAQVFYVLIRIVGLVFLAYVLTKNARRNRFQTLSTVVFIGFVDQVVLKGLWLKGEIVRNPADWTGIEPINSVIFLNMAMGYLFFIPVVLILAFFGMEATRFRRRWKV